LIPHLCATEHGDFVLSMPLIGTSFVLTARMDPAIATVPAHRIRDDDLPTGA
jgi:hypothetical protein